MDTLSIILALAALALAAAAALGWARALRAAGRAQHAESEAARLTEELAREKSEAARRVSDLEAEVNQLTARANDFQLQAAQLAERHKAAQERHAAELARTEELYRERDKERQRTLDEELAKVNKQAREAFEALASRALATASEEFLKRAAQSFQTQSKESQAELDKRREAVERLVKPLSETLTKTEERILKLTEQITLSRDTSEHLRQETGRLVRALSRPEVRGRYGEIQLKRVAELAGMTAYCDFAEQSSSRDDDGRLLRPDMVVRLPSDRMIAVDAKCNTYAYVEAVNAPDDEQREAHLERFAQHVADQVTALGRKNYWSQFAGSPEFVVMFIPGDQFLDAALARRPHLLERAAEQSVILASPSTLIGLLRAVAVGWREHRLAEEAEALLSLGQELHQRAAVAFDHAAKLGDSIRRAVERYNSFASSVDSRLIPTLRKFEQTGVKSSKELSELAEITVRPQLMQKAPDEAAEQPAEASRWSNSEQ